MRTGIFCVYENPDRDHRAAIAAQTWMVTEAERLGFDEAWVAEHHFDDDAVSPSILVLLAHLAGVTRRIRLGSAAVLLAFRDPIQVAEDVATIDLLSNGRFDFGVARGGPFPSQNKHFGIAKEGSRDRMLEALTLIDRLLTEPEVSFTGEHFKVDGVRLTPRPLQSPVPTWVATATDDAVRYAAAHGFGVMGGSPFPLPRLKAIVDTYRAAAPGVDPRLTVARFYHARPTRAQAIDEAMPFVRRFAGRMRGIFLAQADSGKDGNGAHAAKVQPPLDEDAVLERALIGSFDEVREKILHLHQLVSPYSLLLKPAGPSAESWVRSLHDFTDHIRPHLPTGR